MAEKELRRGTSFPVLPDSSSDKSPSDSITLPVDTEQRPAAFSEGKSESDPNLVEFSGVDDMLDPHNWSMAAKVGITACWVLANLVTCIASAIFSSGSSAIRAEFDVGAPVATLGVSLFLIVSFVPYSCLIIHTCA